MMPTRCPSRRRATARFTVTVDLPTPPFPLATTMIRVGIIDADVYGFSIPRMLGLAGQPTMVDQMIIPLEKDGIRVMSIGFLLPNEGAAGFWRGPMLHKH